MRDFLLMLCITFITIFSTGCQPNATDYGFEETLERHGGLWGDPTGLGMEPIDLGIPQPKAYLILTRAGLEKIEPDGEGVIPLSPTMISKGCDRNGANFWFTGPENMVLQLIGHMENEGAYGYFNLETEGQDHTGGWYAHEDEDGSIVVHCESSSLDFILMVFHEDKK